MQRLFKATLIALLVLGLGSLSALAATQYGLGEIVVDASSGHSLTIRPANGSSGIVFFTEIFGLPNVDLISMGPGLDQLSFGSPGESAGAAIQFDVAFGGSPHDDWIVFDARNDGDRSNDELLVRSDRLVLQSNDGDVIIQLGH